MAGGGKSGGDDDGLITEINVTPLVDIMLCLLVIFMVTTTYVVADSIKVDLPKAATGEGTEPSTITLMYTKERALYLNGEASNEAEVRQKIRGELAGNKEVQAIIGADTTVSHGEVIHLIDLVKQEGVVKFALNIETVGRPAEAPPIDSLPVPEPTATP